jgi:hypothetical protein
MRSLRLAILPLLVATSLAAQAPAPANPAPAPVAAATPQRTAFLDIAALVDSRQRFGLEPVVLGRFTLGLVGSRSRTSTAGAPQPIAYGVPLPGPATPTLCPITGCPTPFPGSGADYTAWSLDFAVRYYPAALSFNDPRRRLLVYLGEFVGYQWRTIRSTSYVYPLAPATGNVIPCPAPGCMPFLITHTQRLTGWEPGAEVGARLRPLDPIFIDVGGWFQLVTVDDPMQRIKPGSLDSRLVVALGVGW